ncbi:hypothetical protein Tco_0376668, partial [Tanacetum coccineum]
GLGPTKFFFKGDNLFAVDFVNLLEDCEACEGWVEDYGAYEGWVKDYGACAETTI